MKFRLLPDHLGICRLPAACAVPLWAAEAKGFVSITRTTRETSIICASAIVPAGMKSEPGWRVLEIEGPLAFDVTGVLFSLLGPLANAGIAILAVSTFDTDYILVQDRCVPDSIAALREAGHDFETGPSP